MSKIKQCCVIFNIKSCETAAKYNHFYCLQRAFLNGCPLNEKTLQIAKHYKSSACLNFIKKNIANAY
jgi:hypothetical protein